MCITLIFNSMKNFQHLLSTLAIVTVFASCEVDPVEDEFQRLPLELTTTDLGTPQDVISLTTSIENKEGSRTKGEDDNPPPNTGKSLDLNNHKQKPFAAIKTEGEDDNPPPNTGKQRATPLQVVKDVTIARTEGEDDNPPPKG